VYEFPPSCNTSRQYTERFKEGRCVRLSDCALFEGESFGTCGLGTGACCVFHHSCGHMSNEWISHFTEHPDSVAGPGNGACLYTLEPRHTNVCQYKIEFIEFEIAGPDADSRCSEDFFEVFGGAHKVPRLCGNLKGQHIYVDVKAAGHLQLSVYTSSAVPMRRNWNIRVTQINCDSRKKAPSGCLQYYNATEGVVTSFNKQHASRTVAVGAQPADSDYGVCVAPAVGHCALLWSQRGEAGFAVSGNASRPATIRYGEEGCPRDHVSIPGAVFRDPNTRTLREATRFCGTRLPKIITNSQPYTLRVVTDKNEDFDHANIGFELAFKQVKCVY